VIVRPLLAGDVATYLHNVQEVDAGSGVAGAPHWHPYGRDEELGPDQARDRELRRWSTPLTEPGWRRAWGLFVDSEIVGHAYLAGGALRSELHRTQLGIGLLPEHRGSGGGTRLIESVIRWAREQPGIDWIDLGVFSDNPRARALYLRLGFTVVGSVPDRFRVDGVSLDDTAMALAVDT
jgi:RimJ/RimL family protein N-acetyltransferase